MVDETPSAPGAVRGVAPARQHTARPDAPPDRTSRRATTDRPPFPAADLEAAVQRLDQLLAKDAGAGPRQDVPRRGFYLNILV